jgi:hypothetical protein
MKLDLITWRTDHKPYVPARRGSHFHHSPMRLCHRDACFHIVVDATRCPKNVLRIYKNPSRDKGSINSFEQNALVFVSELVDRNRGNYDVKFLCGEWFCHRLENNWGSYFANRCCVFASISGDSSNKYIEAVFTLCITNSLNRLVPAPRSRIASDEVLIYHAAKSAAVA